jgi:hypothetical protein
MLLLVIIILNFLPSFTLWFISLLQSPYQKLLGRKSCPTLGRH